jgi:hypothetical protein
MPMPNSIPLLAAVLMLAIVVLGGIFAYDRRRHIGFMAMFVLLGLILYFAGGISTHV